MKKLIFGIALLFFGLLLPHYTDSNLLPLAVFLMITGLLLAVWDVFIDAPLQRWWHAPVQLSVLVNDKEAAKLSCLRCDKEEDVKARALALEEVQQALGDTKPLAVWYFRGKSLELQTRASNSTAQQSQSTK